MLSHTAPSLRSIRGFRRAWGANGPRSRTGPAQGHCPVLVPFLAALRRQRHSGPGRHRRPAREGSSSGCLPPVCRRPLDPDRWPGLSAPSPVLVGQERRKRLGPGRSGDLAGSKSERLVPAQPECAHRHPGPGRFPDRVESRPALPGSACQHCWRRRGRVPFRCEGRAARIPASPLSGLVLHEFAWSRCHSPRLNLEISAYAEIVLHDITVGSLQLSVNCSNGVISCDGEVLDCGRGLRRRRHPAHHTAVRRRYQRNTGTGCAVLLVGKRSGRPA
jgi:hypothetical protein